MKIDIDNVRTLVSEGTCPICGTEGFSDLAHHINIKHGSTKRLLESLGMTDTYEQPKPRWEDDDFYALRVKNAHTVHALYRELSERLPRGTNPVITDILEMKVGDLVLTFYNYGLGSVTDLFTELFRLKSQGTLQRLVKKRWGSRRRWNLWHI